MYHIFIHSSVNGYLSCFHILGIVNNAVVNEHWDACPLGCNIGMQEPLKFNLHVAARIINIYIYLYIYIYIGQLFSG